MRVCPKCDKTYTDENLNFCLVDGELLMETEPNDAAPTMILDNTRVTNDGTWGTGYDPGATQQEPQFQSPQFNPQNQQIYQQPFGSPVAATAGKDQTLPLVAVISGTLSIVLSFCCYLGVLLGPVALITGFIGMRNADGNPDVYEGKGLAVAGMIAGGAGLIFSIFMIIIGILAGLFS